MRFDGLDQGDGLRGVAGIGLAAQHHRAFFDGVFDVADDEARAGAGDGFVTEGDDFGVVVAGIDVQQGEGQLQGAAGYPEGFDGKREQDDGVFAAGEEQCRVFRFADDFADDVDGFGFEPVEVLVLDGHKIPWLSRTRKSGRQGGVAQAIRFCTAGHADIAGGFPGVGVICGGCILCCRDFPMPSGRSGYRRPLSPARCRAHSRCWGSLCRRAG